MPTYEHYVAMRDTVREIHSLLRERTGIKFFTLSLFGNAIHDIMSGHTPQDYDVLLLDPHWDYAATLHGLVDEKGEGREYMAGPSFDFGKIKWGDGRPPINLVVAGDGPPSNDWSNTTGVVPLYGRPKGLMMVRRTIATRQLLLVGEQNHKSWDRGLEFAKRYGYSIDQYAAQQLGQTWVPDDM